MVAGHDRYVLLVDDHDDGRELLGEFLSMSGFTVTSAASGAEALSAIAAQGNPALVITDLSLGEMHGADLARRVRAIAAGIPILAVTGHSGYHDSDNLFVAVLVKPVPLNTLIESVNRALASASAP